jgi:hypothetical protein
LRFRCSDYATLQWLRYDTVTTLRYRDYATVQWLRYDTLTTMRYSDYATIQWLRCGTVTTLRYSDYAAVVTTYGTVTTLRYSDYAAAWTAEGSWFDFRRRKQCFLFRIVQNWPGVYPASYSTGTGISLPGGKAMGKETKQSSPYTM